MRRHESPIPRVNPSGDKVWVARYTDADGRRRSAGTFKLKREAQAAIDKAYETPVSLDTVGAYFDGWTRRHPRSERTNRTNEHRIGRLLDVRVEGRRLRHWPLAELKRRHALELVDHMLRVQGRATTGAVGILRALSAMAEDAVTDELLGANPFKGVRVRANDPRARKQPRKPAVFTWEQMHRFAAHAGAREPMVRVLADCGLRLGEMLGLARADFDGEALWLRGAAHNGEFIEGDQATKLHVRRVPVPPELGAMLDRLPRRVDTELLFPTPKGRLWLERNFYRDVWHPIRDLREERDDGEPGELVLPDMQAATPHSFRHSWESHLHAAGIDPADLARVAGHTVATMHGRYIHSLGRSDGRIREAVG